VDVVGTGGGFDRVTSGSEQALREVSDSLLQDLEQLEQLEERKRLLEPEDPEANELAKAVTELAGRVLSRSIAEERITASAHEAATSGASGGPTRPIADTPRATHAILADWRAAERHLAAATPGTSDHAKAALDAERYRHEYQQRFNDRQNAR